ncbi:MAG TPA: queuosine salvage family protein [Ktedonobacterales bacterium]|nr:queuosine salvage family protein [Ktedonobacterales bacterium]
MLDANITPPPDDRLGVLTSTAPVARIARRARIEPAALATLAARWAEGDWPRYSELDALHFRDGGERTANWVLLLDALNFCFWGEPNGPRWRVEWRGETLDGYAALAAALSRALEEGHPLWDAAYLARLDDRTLAHVLRPAAGCPMIPLFTARLENAREVGRVLLARYDGQFTRAIERCEGSAVELTLLLAREVPSFNDVAAWQGEPVRFFKRAQICVADLGEAFAGAGWGAFQDLDRLTAFADYKLPQLLRRHGALTYAPELAEQVDASVPLLAGSAMEVEIRAATIWAVELLRCALAERGVTQTASAIDYRLWAASQAQDPALRPYHRTRTPFY